MYGIDDFYPLIAEQIEAELRGLEKPYPESLRWFVIKDALGPACTQAVELPVEVGEVQREQINNGAEGVAFVTHFARDSEYVLADVLMADPRNSDIRRAEVIREGANVRLGPWEYTV